MTCKPPTDIPKFYSINNNNNLKLPQCSCFDCKENFRKFYDNDMEYEILMNISKCKCCLKTNANNNIDEIRIFNNKLINLSEEFNDLIKLFNIIENMKTNWFNWFNSKDILIKKNLEEFYVKNLNKYESSLSSFLTKYGNPKFIKY